MMNELRYMPILRITVWAVEILCFTFWIEYENYPKYQSYVSYLFHDSNLLVLAWLKSSTVPEILINLYVSDILVFTYWLLCKEICSEKVSLWKDMCSTTFIRWNITVINLNSIWCIHPIRDSLHDEKIIKIVKVIVVILTCTNCCFYVNISKDNNMHSIEFTKSYPISSAAEFFSNKSNGKKDSSKKVSGLAKKDQKSAKITKKQLNWKDQKFGVGK